MQIEKILTTTRPDITGTYWVLSQHTDWNERSAQACCRLRLADTTGEASVLVPSALQGIAGDLTADTIVNATLKPRVLPDGKPGGLLTALEAAKPATLPNIAPYLPVTACPTQARPSLLDLSTLLETLQHIGLQRFVTQVLLTQYRGFLQARAGWDYHHAFAGGLLVHSVAVAQLTQRDAWTIYPADRTRVEIITVAALFHDLGKAACLHKGQHDAVRNHLRHELLTLPLVIPALDAMQRAWPDEASALTKLFAWLAEPASCRKTYCDGEIIHKADMIDVKTDRARHRTLPLDEQRGICA